ncbi:MAG: rhodanese-like domain-containing protein [Thiotrichales bacterium]
MKRYIDLVEAQRKDITEVMPWDLAELQQAQGRELLLLDIREPAEFACMHIEGSLNVPRGILEASCEWDYEETVPELVLARQRKVVVICHSGFRSVLAANTMKQLGYEDACSLKTGLRGWNDYEQPLINAKREAVDIERADEYFTSHIRAEQRKPG